jgi:hypothetical protein
MRYIPLLDYMPPPEWLAKAAKALAEIEAETDPEARKKLIEKRDKVWGDLKDWLLELSNQKCWFSEAKDCFQDWDVEHYRPKKSAKNLDGTEREGYWWLSFDWKNLRVCGRVGNNKKGTFFPLGSDYAANCTNRDTDDEVPYLLDPINPADCVLISFDCLGRAVPASGLDEWSQTRVKVSIKRYKLYFDKLELQRKTIWETCIAYINEIQNLMREQAKSHSAARKARIEERMYLLKSLACRKSPCSTTAIACLLKSENEWARRLAIDAIA